MRTAGASDEEVADFLHAMNKVRLNEFRHIFKSGLSGASLVSYQEWQGIANEAHASHPNFATAKAKGYSEEELMVRGMAVVFRCNESS